MNGLSFKLGELGRIMARCMLRDEWHDMRDKAASE